MAETIYLEVEENPNCSYMPMQAYEQQEEPVPVFRVRLSEPGRPAGIYVVTGWSSEGGGTPCPAMYAPVSDSGQASVHLVFGGDWGVRLKPEDSEEAWHVESDGQFGEPYLMLTDPADVLLDE
jgi:hypothetical protein